MQLHAYLMCGHHNMLLCVVCTIWVSTLEHTCMCISVSACTFRRASTCFFFANVDASIWCMWNSGGHLDIQGFVGPQLFIQIHLKEIQFNTGNKDGTPFWHIHFMFLFHVVMIIFGMVYACDPFIEIFLFVIRFLSVSNDQNRLCALMFLSLICIGTNHRNSNTHSNIHNLCYLINEIHRNSNNTKIALAVIPRAAAERGSSPGARSRGDFVEFLSPLVLGTCWKRAPVLPRRSEFWNCCRICRVNV